MHTYKCDLYALTAQLCPLKPVDTPKEKSEATQCGVMRTKHGLATRSGQRIPGREGRVLMFLPDLRVSIGIQSSRETESVPGDSYNARYHSLEASLIISTVFQSEFLS